MTSPQATSSSLSKLKIGLLALLLTVVLYGSVYFWFRESHSEVRKKNGKEYVIFPTSAQALYWFFRPATYVDGFITGMNFHIGPHQEDQ
jgi:hypothetical protein